ncbi:MAG: hypothetical protein U5K76_15900 [Woeseiaceae bacterium]|nr:hypothetical protein [Woeseiaceae bacterium]
MNVAIGVAEQAHEDPRRGEIVRALRHLEPQQLRLQFDYDNLL